MGDKIARDRIDKQVDAGSVQNLTVNNQSIPFWYWVLLFAAWKLDKPEDMIRAVWRAFRDLIRGRK